MALVSNPQQSDGEVVHITQPDTPARNPAQAVSASLAPSQRDQFYRSLSVSSGPHNIRVLNLDASPDGEGALSGYLQVVSLAEDPVFNALSYVWGKAIESSGPSIRLRSGVRDAKELTLNITPNCKDVLVALRARYGKICIWIDALCIDQESMEERNHQVKLMGDIYSQAVMVYVWLGPASDTDILTMRELSGPFRMGDLQINLVSHWRSFYKADCRRARWNALWQLLRDAGVRHFKYQCQRPRNFLLRLRGRHAGFRSTKPTTLALGRKIDELANKQYFERGWTFQELILATDLTFMCGCCIVSWSSLLNKLGGSWYLENSRKVTPYLVDEINMNSSPLMLLARIWAQVSRPESLGNVPPHSPPDNRVGAGNELHGSVASYHRRFSSILGASWSLRMLISLSIRLTSPWNYCIVAVVLAFILALWPALKESGPVYLIISLLVLFSIIIVCIVAWVKLCWLIPFASCLRAVCSHLPSALDFGTGFLEDDTRQTLAIAIVQAIRTRKTGDSRDRSYAFHGVLSRLGVRLSPVDYAKDAARVYTELMCDLMAWNPALVSLLADAGRTTSSPAGTPSWVPAWGQMETLYPWVDHFRSTQTRDTTPRFTISGITLSIWTKRIATVSFVSDHFQVISPIDLTRQSTAGRSLTVATLDFAVWIYLIGRLGPRSAQYRHIASMITSILEGRPSLGAAQATQDPTGGSPLDKALISHVREEGFNAWYNVLSNIPGTVTSRAADLPRGSVHSEFEDMLWSLAEPEGAEVREYTRQLADYLGQQNRGIFITSKGYAGSGPAAMAQGDEIVLVEGLDVPMVLRKTTPVSDEPTTYIIIGSAFVLGYMGSYLGTDGMEEVMVV